MDGTNLALRNFYLFFMQFIKSWYFNDIESICDILSKYSHQAKIKFFNIVNQKLYLSRWQSKMLIFDENKRFHAAISP